MADVTIFAMVIASAVSLLVVSPRRAQREALRALRDELGQCSASSCQCAREHTRLPSTRRPECKKHRSLPDA
jgi:hypothetical protein